MIVRDAPDGYCLIVEKIADPEDKEGRICTQEIRRELVDYSADMTMDENSMLLGRRVKKALGWKR